MNDPKAPTPIRTYTVYRNEHIPRGPMKGVNFNIAHGLLWPEAKRLADSLDAKSATDHPMQTSFTRPIHSCYLENTEPPLSF